MKLFVFKIALVLLLASSVEANWELYVKPLETKDEIPYYLRKNEEAIPLAGVEQEVEEIVSVDRLLGAKPLHPSSKQIEKEEKRQAQVVEDKNKNWLQKTFQGKPDVEKKALVAEKPKLEDTKEFKEKKRALVETMPSFFVEKKGIDTQDIQTAKESVKSKKVVEVLEEAIAPDKSIPINSKGVPSFSLVKEELRTQKSKDGKLKKQVVKVKVTSIPQLNIGQEKKISVSNFVIQDMQFHDAVYGKLQKLNTEPVVSQQEMDKLLQQVLKKVVDHSDFELKELIQADALVKKVTEAGFVIVQDTNVSLKEIHKIATDEMQFLQAEILYAKGDQCHSATGLYYDLLDSKIAEIRSTSKLKVGICSHKMGLFTDSVKRLLSVLEESSEADRRQALKALLTDLPLEFQSLIGERLERFRDYHLLEEVDKPAFNYVIAKSLAMRDSYSKALAYAEQVPVESKYYSRAQYIASVSEYVAGKVEAAYRRQENLRAFLEKNNKKDDVYSLLSLQMARVSFQRRNYKEAISKFLEIDRNHPMWLQGLKQQAWAQLMLKDEPGAVGNMHSVHTPFFKAVYKPESYVIRALGYINLCQYADAYRSIQNLEGVYAPWLKSMQSYNKKKQAKTLGYYDLVASYLSNPGQNLVLGVPYQVVREMARHKDFLNLQDAINKTYDEKEQYSFLIQLVEKDRREFLKLKKQAKERQLKLEEQIKLAATDKKLLKNLHQWKLQVSVEDFLIDYYDFRIANYKYAKKGMTNFSKASNQTLANRRNSLKKEADTLLSKRMKKMEKNLAQMLQNNELLKYEIFSGAGENIRYRVSGGKTIGVRNPATSDLKKEALNWEFDGEFWEDEVGHYRSSLENVCGKTNVQ